MESQGDPTGPSPRDSWGFGKPFIQGGRSEDALRRRNGFGLGVLCQDDCHLSLTSEKT